MTEITKDTSSKIKAIETEYKGYRFRSRLEARWAIFFDGINLKYEYEQEGYNLGKPVGYYLPDFWFPLLKIYCEIKPAGVVIDEKLYNTFRDNITPILVIKGTPWDYDATWYGWDICDSGGGAGEFDAAFLSISGCGGFQSIVLNDSRSDREFGINNIFESAPFTENMCFLPQPARNMDYNKYYDTVAIAKSKRARFEHGEKHV
jgi:hypothetical protein